MTFPVLSLQTLMDTLAAEFPLLELSEEHFLNPTETKWHDVFTLLLARMTGGSVLDLKARINRYVSSVELSDFRRSSMEVGILAKLLHRVLQAAGIDNFSARDILMPTRKRLVRIMSAIVNYMRYKGELRADYEECHLILQRLNDDYHRLQAQKDTNLSKIEEIKEKTSALKQKKMMLLGSMSEKQSHAEVVNKGIADLISRSQSLMADEANYDESIKSLQQDSENLESMIVQSPARAAREKVMSESKLEQIKTAYEEKLKRFDALSSAVQLQRSIECEQACKLLDSISEPSTRLRQTVTEIKRAKDDQQQRNSQVVDLVAKLQSAKSTVAARQEKLDKQKLQQRLKDDGWKRQLNELQLLSGQISNDSEVLRRIEEENRQVILRTVTQQEEFKARMETLEKNNKLLLHDIEVYNREFFYPFASGLQDMKKIE